MTWPLNAPKSAKKTDLIPEIFISEVNKEAPVVQGGTLDA